MKFDWRLTVLVLLGLFCLITEVNADCKEGESNFTERISYQVSVNRTKRVTTREYTRKCFLFWCRIRQITKYKTIIYPDFELKITENITCCPGFSKNEENVCARGCGSGYYGDNCTMNCTCPENALNDCDRETGKCTCKSGWEGESCNQTCVPGYYGLDCQSRCACVNNSTCNIYHGFCNCIFPGWHGESCEKECDADKYGIHCAESCKCNENQSCDPADGNCTCKPGRKGTECQDECPEGLYGQDCKEKCTCYENGTELCNKTNGQCVCRAGFDGRNCDQDCPPGFYGVRCQDLCADKCNHTSYCRSIDGYCLCFGNKGENCSEDCDNGTYGVNCQEKCNCSMSEICHPFFGNCSCPAGSIGSNCIPKDSNINITALQGPKNGNTGGKIDLPMILAIGGAVVLVGTIVVIVVVVVITKKRRMNKPKEKAETENYNDREKSEDSETDLVENSSYIPLEVVQNPSQNIHQKKPTNKDKSQRQYPKSNANGPAKKDKTSEATPTQRFPDSSSMNAHRDKGDFTVDDVYDRTDARIEREAVNTYNTFEDVKRINASNPNAEVIDEDYNILHEVQKQTKPKEENYDTFANIKQSHATNGSVQEETYDTLNEKQTQQTDVTETYARAQTNVKVCNQKVDLDPLKDVYESQTNRQNETERVLEREFKDFGDEKDVYENSHADINLGKSSGYENTIFHQNHNGFEDDASVYEC